MIEIGDWIEIVKDDVVTRRHPKKRDVIVGDKLQVSWKETTVSGAEYIGWKCDGINLDFHKGNGVTRHLINIQFMDALCVKKIELPVHIGDEIEVIKASESHKIGDKLIVSWVGIGEDQRVWIGYKSLGKNSTIVTIAGDLTLNDTQFLPLDWVKKITQSTSISKSEIKKCTCDKRVLFLQGCICGAVKKYKPTFA